MDWKRGLGIGLLFAGVFLILTAGALTGAVVGGKPQNLLGIFGVIVLIAGMLLILAVEEKPEKYTVKNIESILEDAEGDEKVVFVLDSSGIIDYQKDLGKIIKQYPGRAYVPKRVFEELRKNRRLVGELKSLGYESSALQKDNQEESKTYRKLRKIAKEALRATRKHQNYIILKRIIGEGIVPKGIDNKRLEEYEQIQEEIDSKLRDAGGELTIENRLWLLKKEYRVSKGDIDVLTTALDNARKLNKTKILAHDTHIRDAVNYLREKHPKDKPEQKPLKPYLEYIEYRQYSKSA